jgi:hypothetical protein
MLAHESDSTSWKTCFLPLPTKALVLSHPVNACIPGSASHTVFPIDGLTALMSVYLCLCLVPVQNNILASIIWLNEQARTATYVSGEWMVIDWCPWHYMLHGWHEEACNISLFLAGAQIIYPVTNYSIFFQSQ